MSLINDALKRANQAQSQAAAPAEGPELRPHFVPRPAQRGNDWLLRGLIVVILVLAALLLWQWFRSGSPAVTVRARTIPEATLPSPAAATVSAPVPQSLPAPEKISATHSTPSVSNAPVTAPVSANAVLTNVSMAASVAPAPPARPAYKLQSIFYRPKGAAAVINGKTLFVGDHIAGARVAAIDKESVTIVTAEGETKVMELP